MAFEYDQLNRLLESEGYDNINMASNSWNTTSSYSPLYKNSFTYDANGNIMTQKRFDRTSTTPFDSLTYHYEEALGHKVNNKLRRVTDIAGVVSGIDDIEDQTNPDNYLYDEIGNLTMDDQEGIQEIEWTVSGKVSKITRESTSLAPDLEFHYDPMGNRITKIVKPAGQLANPDQWIYTYYVRDAQGNPMAVYSEFSELDPTTQLPVMRFDLTERYIYGSTRIATDTNIVHMEQPAPTGTYHFRRKLGTKHFELTNHLGNVLAVVTDKKIPVDLGTPDGITDGYLPDVVSISDYYPFGMVMPGRSIQEYRYGFNGQEKDGGIKGIGNSYDFGARIYDPRIGRFLSVDPKANVFSFQSSYQFAGNSPIANIDQEGKYAITIHYLITQQQLLLLGITNAKQVDLLSHYASVYADHPEPQIVFLNNVLFPFNMMFYKDDIDYSSTICSQQTDKIEYSTWHAMKSDFEEENNSISDFHSQLRGLDFGWNKIFESAKYGNLESFEMNTKGIEAFGQGVHALQDSEAHRGVGFERHDHDGDLESDIRAHWLTRSAIQVHQVMNGITHNLNGAQLYLRGMSMENLSILKNKLQSLGYTMEYSCSSFGCDDDFYTYTVNLNK